MARAATSTLSPLPEETFDAKDGYVDMVDTGKFSNRGISQGLIDIRFLVQPWELCQDWKREMKMKSIHSCDLPLLP